jgi:cell wall-associated NlpC family hydrolase
MIFCAAVSGCSTLSFQPAPAPAPVATPAPTPAPVPEQASRRAEALLQALLALGIDYRYGGQSPTTGFDCSGLVAHVFLEAYGKRLPRNTKAQSQLGDPVATTALEAGDLVFFNTLNRPYSHVGIYLGDGRFLHAPKAGARVRVERMGVAYWTKRFDGARRVVL